MIDKLKLSSSGSITKFTILIYYMIMYIVQVLVILPIRLYRNFDHTPQASPLLHYVLHISQVSTTVQLLLVCYCSTKTFEICRLGHIFRAFIELWEYSSMPAEPCTYCLHRIGNQACSLAVCLGEVVSKPLVFCLLRAKLHELPLYQVRHHLQQIIQKTNIYNCLHVASFLCL